MTRFTRYIAAHRNRLLRASYYWGRENRARIAFQQPLLPSLPLSFTLSVSASPLMYAEKNFFGTAERKGVSRYCIAIDSANKTSRLLGYALGTRTKATSLRVSVFISQSQSPTRTRWRPNTCLSDIIALQIAFGNLSLYFVG